MWRPSPQNRRLTRVAPPRAPVPHPFRHTTPSRSSGLSPDTGQTPKASPRPLPETRPHKARDAAALPEDAAVGGAPTGGGVDPRVRSGAHPTAAAPRGIRAAPPAVGLRERVRPAPALRAPPETHRVPAAPTSQTRALAERCASLPLPPGEEGDCPLPGRCSKQAWALPCPGGNEGGHTFREHASRAQCRVSPALATR